MHPDIPAPLRYHRIFVCCKLIHLSYNYLAKATSSRGHNCNTAVFLLSLTWSIYLTVFVVTVQIKTAPVGFWIEMNECLIST